MGGLSEKVKRGNKGQATKWETGSCGELWALRDSLFGQRHEAFQNKGVYCQGGFRYLDGHQRIPPASTKLTIGVYPRVKWLNSTHGLACT